MVNNFLIYTDQKKWVKCPIEKGIINLKAYERFRYPDRIYFKYERNIRKDGKLHGYYFVGTCNAYVIINHKEVRIHIRPYLSRYAKYQLISDLNQFFNASLLKSVSNRFNNYHTQLFNYTIESSDHVNLLSNVTRFLKRLCCILHHYRCLNNNFDSQFQVLYKRFRYIKAVDSKSIQMNMIHFHVRDWYNPIRIRNYNIMPNKLLKAIIISILRQIGIIQSNFNYLMDYLKKMSRINHKFHHSSDYIHLIYSKCESKQSKLSRNKLLILRILQNRFMKSIHLNYFINSRWCWDISELPYDYRVILNNYQCIKHDQIVFDHKSYQRLVTKRFYYLYEIWTYMQTIQAFRKLGFQITMGGIKVLRDAFYYLRHRCNIWMIKQINRFSIKVHLIYNGVADRHNSQVNPFMVLDHRNCEAHDKPDIMVHIYVSNLNQDVYVGSLILDAKCMYKEHISEDSRDKNQFHEYLNNTKFFNDIITDSRYHRNINPTIFVFALYPSEAYTQGLNQVNYNRFFYQKLSPLNHFQRIFIKRIKKCLKYFLIVSSNIPIKDILNLYR